MSNRNYFFYGLFTLLFVVQSVGCQTAGRQTDFIDAAIQRADDDQHGFIQLCLPVGDRRIVAGPSKIERVQRPMPPAARAFDNLYFVGNHWTHAWAITTSDGIIILDAMDNDSDAQHIIAAGLIELGLDPKTIKYVIVSHGHSDHYGGTRYLQEVSGARIVMGEIDWQMIEAKKTFTPKPNRAAPPDRDIAVVPGDSIRLGDTRVELFSSPGHTLGTISPVFTVFDQGRPHRAMLWGGSSFNFGSSRPEQLDAYIDSTRRAIDYVRREGVDILLSNHAIYDRSIDKLSAISATPDMPNPFILGSEAVSNTLQVMDYCAQATAEKWLQTHPKNPKAKQGAL
ncbi:MBL fold metallo-hydrolase [SAR92 clade bacterium H455]|uniref:MBL fold metallo-hydrolase n=1 Tax=SAR92 clade bacterium H455 TaxID=2974818 RepID=A0ABY5TQR8_9GAMM|nr:MBL fold metallo-hydrolase [SAR92 clade bacterium H455]